MPEENLPVETTRKPAIEKVEPDDLYKQSGITPSKGTLEGVKPTFTQRAGMTLATGVGSLIALLTITIVATWLIKMPTLPASLKTGADAEAAQKAYDAINAHYASLFDTVVVKALLPIFTTIIGYIFGARSRDAAENKG